MTTIHRPARGIPLKGGTQSGDSGMGVLATRPVVPRELRPFRAGLDGPGDGAVGFRALSGVMASGDDAADVPAVSAVWGGVVSRCALLDRLAEAERVVQISAPAGSGKTVLIRLRLRDLAGADGDGAAAGGTSSRRSGRPGHRRARPGAGAGYHRIQRHSPAVPARSRPGAARTASPVPQRSPRLDLPDPGTARGAGAYGGGGIVPPRVTEQLTDSETRVLRYLPTHLTTHEIAAELFLSVNTVGTHRRHLYAKLGVHTRHEAVNRARALGLLAPSARRT